MRVDIVSVDIVSVDSVRVDIWPNGRLDTKGADVWKSV